MNRADPNATPPARWHRRLGAALRPWNFVAALRERRAVRRTCAAALMHYRRIATESPASSATDRYGFVVAALTGADADGVRTILRRAEQSFASWWPADRPLIFRDVVQYVAITDRLKADVDSTGVRTRILDIVAAAIPIDL
jgi:hypothetical protein